MRIPIYYPTIAPTRQWICQTILYGDKFSSITPTIQMAFDELEKRVGYEDTKVLLLGKHYIPSLTSDVYLDNRATQRLITSIRGFRRNGERNRVERQRPNIPYDLHREKANHELIQWLQQEGLVNFEHGDWVNVNEDIGFKYMSLIAEKYARESMARDLDNLYIPATDQRDYYRWLTGDFGFRVKKGAMKISLRNQLPIPYPNVSLERLLDFRTTNQDALRRFNVRLETAISNEIAECQSPNDFEDALETIANEILAEVEKLDRSLNNSGIQTYLSSWGHYTAGSDAVTTFCQAVGLTAPAPFQVAGGLLSVVLGGMVDWNRRRGLRQGSDVEYLYLARTNASRHRSVTIY